MLVVKACGSGSDRRPQCRVTIVCQVDNDMQRCGSPLRSASEYHRPINNDDLYTPSERLRTTSDQSEIRFELGP